MDDACHTRLLAGSGQFFRQLNMGALKRGFVAMQDRDQIDHRIVPRHQGGQCGGVVDIDLQNIQHGQRLHVVGMAAPARGHGDANVETG